MIHRLWPMFLIVALMATPTFAQTQGDAAKIEADGNITALRGAIQTGSGTIIIKNIQGIDPEEHRAIAKELGVKDSALESFFKILQQNKVPPEDLDSTLRQIAKHYQELRVRVQTISAADPEVARFRDTADTALEEGKFDQAEALLNRASNLDLKAVREMQKMTKQRLLSAATSLAANGDLKNTQLAYAEAAEYYRQAAGLVPEDELLVLAKYLLNQGSASQASGHYAAAQQPLERSLQILEETFGRTIRTKYLVTKGLVTLANLYVDQGRYSKAELLYKRALTSLWMPSPDRATIMANLGTLYKNLGDYPKAEKYLFRALKFEEKAFGTEHPKLAPTLNNLANLYISQARYAEAEPLYQQARAIREKALGPDHPDMATTLNNLALLYKSQGRYTEAEPLYQQARAITEKALGPDHPDLATTLNNLAGLYTAQDRYAEAEPLYLQAQAIREKVLGPNHPHLATTLHNLALLYKNQGRYAEAEPLYQQARAITEKALGPAHPNSVTIRKNYTDLLEKMKQADITLSTPE